VLVRVVLDANVAAAGIVFRGEPWAVLLKLARRNATAFGSDFTLAETRDTVSMLSRLKKSKANPGGALRWYLGIVKLIEPAPLGKQRSRDADDDPYLAVALAAGALIVTYDKDLLEMGKPFGIEILRPSQFLNRFRI
jgi:putative PIN family toxin of toxin-antitoxin system